MERFGESRKDSCFKACLAECDITNDVHALCLTTFLADGLVYSTDLPPARHELLLLLGIVVSAGHLVCSLFCIVGEEVVNGNFKEPNNNRRQNEKEKATFNYQKKRRLTASKSPATRR